MALRQTPSLTIGPYFRYCLTPESYGHRGIATGSLLLPGIVGEKIRIVGQVFDGAGAAMTDALVEIWQADAQGIYPQASVPGKFNGFGRVETDKDGRFHFETIKPGPVPGRGNRWQAPHINIIVSARGMLGHVFTRLYFSDEQQANSQDEVLNTVPADRRPTLIAEPDADGIFRLDIRIQGDNETVFFDL
jgi:protocatechuate 3,4-dioxygenase alpha subunit